MQQRTHVYNNKYKTHTQLPTEIEGQRVKGRIKQREKKRFKMFRLFYYMYIFESGAEAWSFWVFEFSSLHTVSPISLSLSLRTANNYFICTTYVYCVYRTVNHKRASTPAIQTSNQCLFEFCERSMLFYFGFWESENALNYFLCNLCAAARVWVCVWVYFVRCSVDSKLYAERKWTY